MHTSEILTKRDFLEGIRQLSRAANEDPFRLIPDEIDKRLAQHILGYKSIQSIEYLERTGKLQRLPNTVGVRYSKSQIQKLYYERNSK